MSHWEAAGLSDEWYTPRYVFDALGCQFDMDVAGPLCGCTHVPARHAIAANSLNVPWQGFVWMNPPFGGRNGLKPWLDKFFEHGNGIALVPDRTSAPWWQEACFWCDAFLLVAGKIKFERPDGSVGKSPSTGTTLFGVGPRAVRALHTAQNAKLGIATVRTQCIRVPMGHPNA